MNGGHWKRTLAIPILAAAISVSAGLAADEEERVRDALNQLKQNQLITVLELPDDDEATFLALYNHWDEVRWEFKRQRDELITELRAKVLRGEGRDLNAILADIDATDAASREKEAELRAQFRQILTDIQYAKLLIFEDSFSKNLRRLVQERQRFTDNDGTGAGNP